MEKELIYEFLQHYSVSKTGIVVRKKDNRQIVFSKDYKGYLRARIPLKNISKHPDGRIIMKLHRIVASVYIENPLNKPQVNHINGIKTDNRVENLEWCNNSENAKHGWTLESYIKRRQTLNKRRNEKTGRFDQTLRYL